MDSKIFNGYTFIEDGTIISKRGKPLKKRLHRDGYIMFLMCINGVCKNKLVHREIAKLFIPNPLNKPDVNHKDRNKENNSVSNLEWVTKSENSLHAPGRKGKTGAACYNSKIVLNINTGIFYESIAEAAKSCNIERRTISYRVSSKNNNTPFIVV